MPVSPALMKICFSSPVDPIVYFDVRYRRPNSESAGLAALVQSLHQISFAGVEVAVSSLSVASVAFIPMFLIHIVDD